MIQSIDALRLTLKELDERKPGSLQILAAVAGISRRRLEQIMNGEGELPTMHEVTTINMLKNA